MKRHVLAYGIALLAFAALPAAGFADKGGPPTPPGNSANAPGHLKAPGQPAAPTQPAQPAQADKPKQAAAKQAKRAKPAKPAKRAKPAKPAKPAKAAKQPKPAQTDRPARKVTICHATGSESNPYVEITISENALDAHLRHGDRTALPCPAGGQQQQQQPEQPKQNGNDKVTICHATGSESNPYVEITISENAVEAHRRHQDGRDVIPAPAGGCPGGSTAGSPTGQLSSAPTGTTTTGGTPTSAAGGNQNAASPSTSSPKAKAGTNRTPRVAGVTKRQTAKQTGVRRTPRPVLDTVRRGNLPFTGVPIWVAFLLAGGLITLGVLLRRRATAIRHA